MDENSETLNLTIANASFATIADGTITVTAGSLTGSASFTITDDALDEVGETIITTLGAPTGAMAVSPTTQTITVQDNDATP